MDINERRKFSKKISRISVLQHFFFFNSLFQKALLKFCHEFFHVQNEVFLVLYSSFGGIFDQVGFLELIQGLDSEESLGLVNKPFGVGLVDVPESIFIKQLNVD